jgi:SNF2 family DNA or RNA helicase
LMAIDGRHRDAPSDAHYEFAARRLPEISTALLDAGWKVEAYGKPVRKSTGASNFSVKSDIDWFELTGEFEFDGSSVGLPELLKAVRTKSDFVELDDGSYGMIPEEWIQKYGGLVNMANTSENGVRFAPSQALLLDALLAGQSQTKLDKKFQSVCRKFKQFSGIEPRSPPRTFKGQLRDYQKQGLGWLNFLKTFRLGGCLADDMGLGKTVQVLALLEARRTRRLKKNEVRLPSLIVVPKSLIFNWIAEAERFTPRLKIVAYHGKARHELTGKFDAYDAIVTTYGTLRLDIAKWQEQRFDFAILDEAQAIKNPQSQSAKACRLLDADYRLALSGTPIENHLGELWSLFEFLNPGILGRSDHFKAMTQQKKGVIDATGLQLVASGLRPFILRRTKEQVLTELPEKNEQTLYCEMPPAQKKLYGELRDFYRLNLNQTIKEKGLAQSKIHVLEALLRLRQAACHPALIDGSRAKIPSAKLQTLLEQLDELAGTGHKALVFSQFTSFLALVRNELDKRGTTYEYLDGKTSNRGATVDRFQTDPECTVFLISLKAGGQGLNLTAADYVFILDPWWNPAVEAQAIDRAHRMGQERRVIAYRLISKDTVEERIMEMQRDKKQLADAVITADNSLIRSLTAEDLQILLT